MRKLWHLLWDYWREAGNARLYLGLGVFLAFSLAVNYGTDWVQAFAQRAWSVDGILRFAVLYALPFYVAVLACCLSDRDCTPLRRRGFWGLSLAGLLLYGLYANLFFAFEPWIMGLPAPIRYYAAKLLANGGRALPMAALLFLMWLLTGRRTPFYGFRARGFDARPYFWMLLLVLPLVLGASFLPSFQQAYPQYEPYAEQAYWGLPAGLLYLGFEFSYGLDFVFVELFFRGFLIAAMARYLGPKAVLPMVCWYCFIHFQKPPGEAITSIAGGWVLGVAALRTGSLYGGIIIHLGVAYLMEAAAIWQRGGFS